MEVHNYCLLYFWFLIWSISTPFVNDVEYDDSHNFRGKLYSFRSHCGSIEDACIDDWYPLDKRAGLVKAITGCNCWWQSHLDSGLYILTYAYSLDHRPSIRVEHQYRPLELFHRSFISICCALVIGRSQCLRSGKRTGSRYKMFWWYLVSTSHCQFWIRLHQWFLIFFCSVNIILLPTDIAHEP